MGPTLCLRIHLSNLCVRLFLVMNNLNHAMDRNTVTVTSRAVINMLLKFFFRFPPADFMEDLVSLADAKTGLYDIA